MRNVRWIAALTLFSALALSGQALACSISKTLDTFVPDPALRTSRVFLEDLPEIPGIAVDFGRMQRTSSMVACDPWASVELRLRWAAPTELQWQDVGVYVQRVSEAGTSEFPLRVRLVDGLPSVTIDVLDPEPSGALDVEYEIRAVDARLRLGPPTRFRVRSPARPAEPYEQTLRTASSTETADPPSWLVTDGLRAKIDAGQVRLERCGAYLPYGCGATETVLLARGEMTIGPFIHRGETFPTACIGVRQSSGRVARIVLSDQAWRTPIAAAEWVDDVVPGDWPRVASGCGALLARAKADEVAYACAYMKAHLRRGIPPGVCANVAQR